MILDKAHGQFCRIIEADLIISNELLNQPIINERRSTTISKSDRTGWKRILKGNFTGWKDFMGKAGKADESFDKDKSTYQK